MKPLNLVFAGTPEFSLPCLKAICNSKHTLKGIYTQPDRAAGRGRKQQPSAVKQWALEQKLPVFQPLNFKNPAAIEDLKALKPDLMIVIAYGLILPKTVLQIPRLGCINVHASLLPRWRGASPIQQAILHGDKETGITIMQMNEGMDTGDILCQAIYSIQSTDTGGSLHNTLAELGVVPLIDTIEQLASGQIQPVPQTEFNATYAPKIKKEDGRIAWHQSAQDIERLVRAFYPWPGAYTKAQDQTIKIHQASVIHSKTTTIPGTIVSLNKQGMRVATGDSLLNIEIIQFPGKKPISILDYLNANHTILQPEIILK